MLSQTCTTECVETLAEASAEKGTIRPALQEIRRAASAPPFSEDIETHNQPVRMQPWVIKTTAVDLQVTTAVVTIKGCRLKVRLRQNPC